MLWFQYSFIRKHFAVNEISINAKFVVIIYILSGKYFAINEISIAAKFHSVDNNSTLIMFFAKFY